MIMAMHRANIAAAAGLHRMRPKVLILLVRASPTSIAAKIADR
jgi:hypothetical protein